MGDFISLEFILISLLSHFLISAYSGSILKCFRCSKTTDDDDSLQPHETVYHHWIVSVGWSDNGKHRHLCPGALKDVFGECGNIVITSAICLSWFPHGARKQVMLANMKIVLISNVEQHGDYNRKTAENNIAILILHEIVYGAGAQLSNSSHWDNPGEYRYVGDWTIEEGSTPEKPVDYTVMIAKPERCRTARYPFKSEEMICVEAEQAEDNRVSLPISYGAPLYAPNNKYREDILVGIYSQRLSHENLDIYVRLSAYRDWISETIRRLLPQHMKDVLCLFENGDDSEGSSSSRAVY